MLHDLITTDVIDAAVADLWTVFPKPDKFHDDPARYIPPGKDTETLRRGYPEMPEHGPWFRPDQHRWGHEFPFMGRGALNRLYVHPAIVDFAERALETRDIRLYQSHVEREVHRRRRLRAAHAHRSEPLVPAVGARTAVVARRDVRVPLGRRPRLCADPRGEARRLAWPIDERHLLPGSGRRAVRGRAGRGGQAGLGSRVPQRGVPSGSEHHAAAGVTFLVDGRRSRAPTSTGSTTTRCSRSRRIRDGRASSKGRRRGSSSCSASRRPAIAVWTSELIDATQVRYPQLDLDPWRHAL